MSAHAYCIHDCLVVVEDAARLANDRVISSRRLRNVHLTPIALYGQMS
jgi:hypothetical protein